MNYKEFLKQLDEIKSFRGRIALADKHFTRIGSGSGRIVYLIDDDKVLKLARNAKGIAQNDVESDAGMIGRYDDVITKVFDASDKDWWLLAEKAKKITPSRFKELVGFDLDSVRRFMMNYIEQSKGGKPIFHMEQELVDEMYEDEFIMELTSFADDYAQSAGDMGRPSTYGEVIRDGKPTIVLTDYGLTDEVFDTHYAPKKRQTYKVFEIYGGYGNNDWLSDIGNVSQDVRHRMKAFVPDGVGDGLGLVNEVTEFKDDISTVLEKERTKENIPELLDAYHNSVNNIHTIVNTIDNPQYFYLKLLDLQEFLKNSWVLDRPQLKAVVERVNEGGSATYSTDYGIGDGSYYEKRGGEAFDVIPEDLEYKRVSDATADEYVMDENIQKMDKEYVKPGHFTEQDRENVLEITGGDAHTYDVAKIYDFFMQITNPNLERTDVDKYDSHIKEQLNEYYNELRNYNKNVIPIEGKENLEYGIELATGLKYRKEIIDFLKKIPSVYLRNLKEDIRKPRTPDELNYGPLRNNYIPTIKHQLNNIERLSSEKQGKIFKKIFSSKNDTFEKVAEQIDKLDILFLDHEGGVKELRDKINYEVEHDEARKLYDDGEIIVVSVKSSDAMKNLGCGTQWCFATEIGTGEWEEYSQNKNVNIVYNFNEPSDSRKRMVLLLPSGGVYDMYNDDLEDGMSYFQEIGVEKYLNAGEKDAVDAEEELAERKKAWIPGSQAVEVKPECRIGGLNGTSKACNQGDIDNLIFTTIKEYFENLNERKKAWMSGAKSVEVKDACRLGGKGDGTSKACNQGDIDNLVLKSLNEEDLLEYIKKNMKDVSEMVGDTAELDAPTKTKPPISYSAVVINDSSKDRLIKAFQKIIPKDWEIVADHMTINLGEIKPELEKYVGMKVRLEVNSFAMDDMVLAAGVDGFESEKEYPHITIAINKKAGASSKMSNDLKDWVDMKRPLMVFGYVKEIPFKL